MIERPPKKLEKQTITPMEVKHTNKRYFFVTTISIKDRLEISFEDCI